MKLILSRKAAKQIKRDVSLSDGFIPDIHTWKIDGHKLEKRSLFLITNEISLYTYITSYRSGLKGILHKLATSISGKVISIEDVRYIKFQNPSVVGSMTQIKNIITQMDKYSRFDNENDEKLINQTPFKYLSERSPVDVHGLTA